MNIGVVGGGVFGLSSAWELSRRGHKVKVFERGAIPAPDASGTDISKAIRLEYGSCSSIYTPLVYRAFERWREAQSIAGREILHQTGALFLVKSYQAGTFEFESAPHVSALGIETEHVEPSEACKRWPAFQWDHMDRAIFNPIGGWLAAADAVRALAECCRLSGVEIQENCPVLSVKELAASSQLTTALGTSDFDAVVVAAGPWLQRLLPKLADKLRVSRQRMTHYRPLSTEGLSAPDFPVWVWDLAESGWYGFPANSEGVVKVALHRRSETVDPDASREIDPDFLALSRQFVTENIPGLNPSSPLEGCCCFYTNSESGNFLIDQVPGHQRTFVASGGSGHGFKFGPVIGELVADRVEGPGEAAFRLDADKSLETW